MKFLEIYGCNLYGSSLLVLMVMGFLAQQSLVKWFVVIHQVDVDVDVGNPSHVELIAAKQWLVAW